MRFLKPVLVPVFESEVPILFITRSLLIKMFLSHHVQFPRTRQICAARRLLSRILANPISRPFFWCSAISGAMRVERRHRAHRKRGHGHHHKKTQQFELFRHCVATQRLSRICVNGADGISDQVRFAWRAKYERKTIRQVAARRGRKGASSTLICCIGVRAGRSIREARGPCVSFSLMFKFWLFPS
jgi:hypothetical protein